MDSELTSILKSVKQKTGIDIDAYAETMKFSATTREEADWVLPSETSFNELFSIFAFATPNLSAVLTEQAPSKKITHTL